METLLDTPVVFGTEGETLGFEKRLRLEIRDRKTEESQKVIALDYIT